MKNKLYVSLFAVVASGAVTVSVIGTGRDGHGIAQPVMESEVRPMLAIQDRSMAEKAKFMLGSNPETYAPSEDEIFLRKTAQKLNDIANGLSQLRQNHLDIFNRYFGQEGTEKSEAFEADDNDELDEGND